MPKKYIVDLSQTEQKSLQKLTRTGKQAAYKINHGRILLLFFTAAMAFQWHYGDSTAQPYSSSMPRLARASARSLPGLPA